MIYTNTFQSQKSNPTGDRHRGGHQSTPKEKIMSLLFEILEKEKRQNEFMEQIFGSSSNLAPTHETIELISRNHQCGKCSGAVEYVQIPDKGINDYHFVCKECGHTDIDAPLKKK